MSSPASGTVQYTATEIRDSKSSQFALHLEFAFSVLDEVTVVVLGDWNKRLSKPTEHQEITGVDVEEERMQTDFASFQFVTQQWIASNVLDLLQSVHLTDKLPPK